MLALNAGMRDAEMKTLTWAQVNFEKRYLAVGRQQDRGRRRPNHSSEFRLATKRLGLLQVVHGAFRRDQARMVCVPIRQAAAEDPTRPVTTLKTAWRNLREKAR